MRYKLQLIEWTLFKIKKCDKKKKIDPLEKKVYYTKKKVFHTEKNDFKYFIKKGFLNMYAII